MATVHAVGMALTGIASIGWEKVPNIYGTLSIFVAFCFLWFMLQGVLKENTIQLVFSILSAILVTLYLIWFFLIDESRAIVAALAFGSACFCLIYLVLSPCVIAKFGWYRYNKSQTTNKHTMDMFYIYQKFQAVLLFDAEVCLMLGLLVTFELKHQIEGYIGNIACILFEICWVMVGIISVRREHRSTVLIFMLCTLFLVAYVVVICYWVVTDKKYSENVTEAQFFVMGALALICRVFTLYWTWRVMRNFDKGLRSYFDQGGHYIDIWGGSQQQLLAPEPAGNVVSPVMAGNNNSSMYGGNNDADGGMSSRSRIHSDDFD